MVYDESQIDDALTQRIVDDVTILYPDKTKIFTYFGDINKVLSETTLEYVHIVFYNNRMYPVYVSSLYCILTFDTHHEIVYDTLIHINKVVEHDRKRQNIKHHDIPGIEVVIENGVCSYMFVSIDYKKHVIDQDLKYRYSHFVNKEKTVSDTLPWYKKFFN